MRTLILFALLLPTAAVAGEVPFSSTNAQTGINGALGIATGDLDQDGDLDYVATAYDGDDLYVASTTAREASPPPTAAAETP